MLTLPDTLVLPSFENKRSKNNRNTEKNNNKHSNNRNTKNNPLVLPLERELARYRRERDRLAEQVNATVDKPTELTKAQVALDKFDSHPARTIIWNTRLGRPMSAPWVLKKSTLNPETGGRTRNRHQSIIRSCFIHLSVHCSFIRSFIHVFIHPLGRHIFDRHLMRRRRHHAICRFVAIWL